MVAAIGGVMGGVVMENLNAYEGDHDLCSPVASVTFGMARELRSCLETAVSHVKQKKDATFQEYHARRLVEMAADTIIGYLLCIDALVSERKHKVAAIYVGRARHRVQSNLDHILSDDCSVIEYRRDVIGENAGEDPIDLTAEDRTDFSPRIYHVCHIDIHTDDESKSNPSPIC